MSALRKGIISNHKGDFYYCLNDFQSYSTKEKLEKHKDVCKNHDYCYVEMPREDKKILKNNHGEKSKEVAFIIYADLESSLKKEHFS